MAGFDSDASAGRISENAAYAVLRFFRLYTSDLRLAIQKEKEYNVLEI